MDAAQDRFKVLLRDHIALCLRDLGFKGSGQNFSLPSETHWALLWFQRSQWSSAETVSFTVNLTVVSREVWDNRPADFNLPDKPGHWDLAPFMHDELQGEFWHRRIGELMPRGLDHWWDVTDDASAEALTEEVVAAIRDYALPAMRRQMT